jgi:formiminoglutamase
VHRPVEMELWKGRTDEEEGAERWHQKVKALTPEVIDAHQRGIVLLGVCSDTGVRRNQGRSGADKGPDVIRAALGNQAWHLSLPCYDAGDLHCTEEDDLEELQKEQAEWVAKLLDLGHFPLVLGGGHEIAFGSHMGLRQHLKLGGKKGAIGIINFDAHFDLRSSEVATSGTPFLQIAESYREESLPFRYLCLGVSEVANTVALFGRAAALGVQWLLDEQMTSWNLVEVETQLRDFVKSCEFVHLTVDLDVLPAAVAPGVSAPSPRGVPLEIVERLLRFVKIEAGEKLKVADLAECNPEFDIDSRTAKVAARLCHLLARKEPA